MLATGLGAPSSQTLRRLQDRRAAQFWDPGRLLSKTMGEHDNKSIVWDYIAIYKPGQVWQQQAPPDPIFKGWTIVRVIDTAKQRLKDLLGP